jgi:hypothetical protein
MFGHMELWSPPHDAPHLYEWWRPLVLASRRARLERVRAPVYVDEFRLAGKVARRDRPDIWIYEHHGDGGSLCVDSSGDAYRYVAAPSGRGLGQFRRCPMGEAVRRAGLTRPGPDGAPEPDAAVAAVGGAEAPPQDRGHRRVIRRGHLTLVAG